MSDSSLSLIPPSAARVLLTLATACLAAVAAGPVHAQTVGVAIGIDDDGAPHFYGGQFHGTNLFVDAAGRVWVPSLAEYRVSYYADRPSIAPSTLNALGVGAAVPHLAAIAGARTFVPLPVSFDTLATTVRQTAFSLTCEQSGNPQFLRIWAHVTLPDGTQAKAPIYSANGFAGALFACPSWPASGLPLELLTEDDTPSPHGGVPVAVHPSTATLTPTNPALAGAVMPSGADPRDYLDYNMIGVSELCQATWISSEWLVTAAHCIDGGDHKSCDCGFQHRRVGAGSGGPLAVRRDRDRNHAPALGHPSIQDHA